MTLNNKVKNIDHISSQIVGNFALCYGHFNLTHPGHLRYLQQAKGLEKTLVVAVKSDESLDAESFGQHFSETERAESLAHLEIVSHVVILDKHGLGKLIKILKPSVLVLGREFENQNNKEIELAISEAKKFGRVVFHAGETSYASTHLLHHNVSDIESRNISRFRNICKINKITYKKLQNKIKIFSDSKLLVIGDTIVDNYVACDAVGMSAEAPVLVVKQLDSREFIGGAAIVASHVKALGSECHFISVVGDDKVSSNLEKILSVRGIHSNLIVDSSRPTTYKTRFMVENQKLFRVSKIKDHAISETIESMVIKKLQDLAPKIDGILVSDFVYGVITPGILTEIYNLASKYNLKLFGDLQCSSQVGKVTKFKNFDLITPTEKEARIALDDNENGLEWLANELIDKTKAKNLLMKLGSDGFIAYGGINSGVKQNFPSLISNPVDVAGAGDSLFAAMAVALTSNATLIEASAIGSCMASLAIQELGNIPITHEKLDGCIQKILS